MDRGDRTPPSEILVQIVDPAVVDEAPIGVEDRRLRRYLDVTLLDKGVLRIAEGRNLVTEVPHMLANHFGRFRPARIDQPKYGFADVLHADALYRWGISIRNGAVGSNEEQNHDF